MVLGAMLVLSDVNIITGLLPRLAERAKELLCAFNMSEERLCEEDCMTILRLLGLVGHNSSISICV
jgi:hypothetical protein